jgi:hypothetical protein
MGYWESDLMERRHRQAILERKFAFHDNYGGLAAAIEENFVSDYDNQLRTRHAAFLDSVRRDNVLWMSPRLERVVSEALIEEILDAVRHARRSTHLTERMGFVITSVGTIYWAIRKSGNFRELLHAAWTRTPFNLELWHSDDVAVEKSVLT